MAIDKAIDSAKEAACRLAEANAIREKTGGTAPINYDYANRRGFAAAIASITPAKPEQSKTLTLGAAAPSTVTPDSGKVLSSVPVVLDTSVIKAENIKKDVTMLGVTGTHEGGGSSGGYLEHLTISNFQTAFFFLKDIFVDNCRFENGMLEFDQRSSNVTFRECTFYNVFVTCTQEIHDAIVNGENNDYEYASFNIIS